MDYHASKEGTGLVNDPIDLVNNPEVKSGFQNDRLEPGEEKDEMTIQTPEAFATTQKKEAENRLVFDEEKERRIETPAEVLNETEEEEETRTIMQEEEEEGPIPFDEEEEKEERIATEDLSREKEEEQQPPEEKGHSKMKGTAKEEATIRREKKRIWYFILLVLILIGSLVAVFFYFFIDGEDNSSSNSLSLNTKPTGYSQTKAPSSENVANPPTLEPTTLELGSLNPTTSPSQKPTNTPTQQPTKDLRIDLVDFLRSDYGVNIPTDSSAPIQKAVDWLAEEAQIDGNLDLSKKTFQRFTLLVFYYSLLTTDLEIETEVASYLRSDNMLFDLTLPNWGMRKQDECMWPGVSCNESGNVKMIKLNDMAIQGTIATELGFLTDLIHFDMSNNKLEGTIPEELYDLEDMEQLFLYDNQIGGTISTKIGNLWKLTHYQLSQNQLTGTIPETLKSSSNRIRSLRYFNVQYNRLTGTIPQNMRLRMMYYFDLGSNKLVGTVPEDLGAQSARVRHLYLDHNRFTGTIPSSIINAGDGFLRSLALNDNQFTGDLPGDHEQFRKMDQLMVQNNDLDGMNKKTCDLSVFMGGEMVEFKSDCDICRCKDFMCDYCTEK